MRRINCKRNSWILPCMEGPSASSAAQQGRFSRQAACCGGLRVSSHSFLTLGMPQKVLTPAQINRQILRHCHLSTVLRSPEWHPHSGTDHIQAILVQNVLLVLSRHFRQSPLNTQGRVGMHLKGAGGGCESRAGLGRCLWKLYSGWFWGIAKHMGLELHAEKICVLIHGHLGSVLMVHSSKNSGNRNSLPWRVQMLSWFKGDLCL